MSELDLTLYIYDSFYIDNDYLALRKILQCCHVKVIHINLVADTTPELNAIFKENLTKLQVVVKFDEDVIAVPKHYSYHQRYYCFIQNWCEQVGTLGSRQLPKTLKNLVKMPFLIEKPWLMVHNPNVFPYSKKASHEKIMITTFRMGTLFKSNVFFAHYQHEFIMQRNGYVDKIDAFFYHDTREFELLIGKNCVMSFHYNNIRRIMVELKNGKACLYFYLVNPPALTEIEYLLNDKPKKRRVSKILKMTPDHIGRSNAISLEISSQNLAMEIVSRLYFRCGKKPIAFGFMYSTLTNPPLEPPSIDFGDFACTYIVNAILKRNFVLQLQEYGTALNDTLKMFQDLVSISSSLFYEAGVEALQALDEGLFLNYRNAIYKFFNHVCNTDKESLLIDRREIQKKLLPPHTKTVWRLVITPTRLVYFPAEVNFENRIIRNYDSEYALRVSFRDEDFRKLSFSSKRSDEIFVKDILSKPIIEGIRVASRHFEFLGWSNSQLRDHAVFMYAQDPQGNSAETIRSWMGNFSQIKSVAKFMARMGQCFSHSEASITVPLNSSRIITEPDIIGGLNPVNSKPYVFSDGVGKISEELMKEVTKVLGFDYVPSAIQFRYAGYKGMLTMDPTLKDFDIVFRESQKKFSCEDSDCLEVVNKSKPVEVLLNRNIISILDHKGIRSSVFMGIQQEMLKDLTQMLFDSDMAAKYLTAHSALPKLKYKELASAGICCNSEPLFRNMLLAQHRIAIEGLRTKTRLYIDPSEGRNMFGVLDECDILEYGQVFVQYTVDVEEHPTKLDTNILTGNVLVTKNPCLQPGDVRVFRAIDVPELHHIVDCIVFPRKGPRPHPNEMAGSDLDGDEYTVIWKKDLIFELNSEPSHFPIAQETVHVGSVTIYDMLDFLSFFIVNDQIGVIGHAHLAQADAKGLLSDVCHSIASKHSIAVDFAKNGQQVALEDDEKPDKYPDFMEKGSYKNSYQSKKALGKLYRVIKNYEDENKMVVAEPFNVEIDLLLIYPGWDMYKDAATKLYHNYSKAIGLLLSTYGILNEHEACAKAFSNVHRRAGRNERLDIEEIVTVSLRHLWKTTKDEFYKDFPAVTENADELATAVLKKASACYVVAYSQEQNGFLSFPWVFWEHLVQIRRLHTMTANIDPVNPYVSNLHHKIELALERKNITPLDVNLRKKCSDLVEEFQVNGDEVRNALTVLHNWACANGIINNAKTMAHTMSSIYFADIFLKSVKENKVWLNPPPNTTELILNFLNFTTSSLYSKSRKICENRLNERSTSTYHSLAVGGDLRTLKLQSGISNGAVEDAEMDPIRVDKALLKRCFDNDLESFKKKMLDWSGAIEINVREKSDFCLVSASGSNSALIFIRKFLMKISGDNLQDLIDKINNLSVNED